MKHFRLKRIVALAMFLFVGLPAIMAQVKVSGQVVDEQGEPLMAVSILEKGTTNGIITDLDGNFELSVKDNGAVLVISYVGYITQEVKVQTGRKMNIVLKEDSQALEELERQLVYRCSVLPPNLGHLLLFVSVALLPMEIPLHFMLSMVVLPAI